MAETIRRIPVSPDSELAQALDAAKSAESPVAVDTGDTIYELFVSRTQSTTPSGEATARCIAGIKEAAGSWKGVDIEQFRAYRRERRKLHTRAPIDL